MDALQGRAADVKGHRWFEGVVWEELEARRVPPPRKPRETDSSKRIKVGGCVGGSDGLCMG